MKGKLYVNRYGISRKKYKRLRDENGFKQESVADFLGLSGGLLSRIEKGERPLQEEYLERLSGLYGCTVSDLTNKTHRTRNTKIELKDKTDKLDKEDLETIYMIKSIAYEDGIKS